MCVSYWVLCLIGVSQGCDISNCYCFPIANWRKEIFFHLWLHRKTAGDISTCPTGIFFLCNHDTRGARSIFRALKTSRRQPDLQKASIHMLWPSIRSVEEEASRKGLPKDPKHMKYDARNNRNSSRAHSCTENYEEVQIKQGQILHLETISWPCLFPQHPFCLSHLICWETSGRSCLLTLMTFSIYSHFI